MTTSALAPTVVLRRGAVLPRLGLGTASLDEAATERAVATAIELGYRLIDTAENYRNEVGVGRGLKAAGIARSDVFVTTKFNRRWHGVELAQQAFEASAARLGVDYVDLLLIHWPNPDQNRYVEAWQGLLRLFEQGRVRAIGTSNFKPAHLDRLLAETGELPDVNQIQVNPDLARPVPRAYHEKHGIVTMAWSPLGGSRTDVLKQPAVTTMAERHGKTPAQIVLRWHIELGLVPIPRSSNRERLAQNLAIFDFSLSADELQALSALDRGESAAADSDTTGH
ncbi:MAG: aldo/keto reductase [Chloroflexi bacterium]|nr:aldo/keto reductase [Chloroflexota bacterium]